MTFDNLKPPGFKQVMHRAKAGQRICYHSGELGRDRLIDGELDQAARYVNALYDIGTARLYQKRDDTGVMQYYVVLTKALTVRKDQSGTEQDAERLMELYAHG